MIKKKNRAANTDDANKLPFLEAKYRKATSLEVIPYAMDTSYSEIAKNIAPRKKWKTYKYRVYKSYHLATTGLQQLLMKIKEFYEIKQKSAPMDLLSVSGGLEDGYLFAVTLFRIYDDYLPNTKEMMIFLGENFETKEEEQDKKNLFGLTSDKRRPIKYTEEELTAHKKNIEQQNRMLEDSTEEQPFLNSIEKYERTEMPKYEKEIYPLYLLKERDRQIITALTYEKFTEIFNEAIRYLTSVEMEEYYNVLRGKGSEKAFMATVQEYLIRTFITRRSEIRNEDLDPMLKKIHKALFDLYIVQDLIDDPLITDIKITSYDSIRVRIKGKAYLSDITFVDERDYIRFVNALIIKNNIDDSVPEQTFTDNRDKDNILRFTISMAYISADNIPTLHIRKISRKKMLADDLIKAGMFDEKIRDYLLDCGKHSTGVIFSGAPGSGKTVALNWFLEEAYEDSAEILVIQENDELFSYRKGIMFQHVVNNPVNGQRKCTLEDLGQLALVAGANVFVIGEAKGAEVCSAITLANSGCRTALTVHSRSANETLDKMADLAMRGYAQSFEQAKRMMKSFQTIVFLKDFKVYEISEVVGFDEEKKDIIYKPIYRRPSEADSD